MTTVLHAFVPKEMRGCKSFLRKVNIGREGAGFRRAYL